ncbi:MAG: nucleotide sugar dehydrogenase [Minisyncoccales bacterium]
MNLLEKIESRSAKVCVIGLGYVGLPLAVEKAKAGYSVIGVDIQKEKVDLVNSGHNYIGDVLEDDLKHLVESGKLKATTDFDIIKDCDVATICVPTPLDKFKQPDVSYIVATSKEVAKRLHKEMLIVLESTTYPGTTEEIVLPILLGSGLKVGTDFYLAFSPERVDPGNKLYKTKNTPKVVGGVTPACTEHAVALYENVLEAPVFAASSPGVAEMEKILENTFRIVNIALINEMAILCDKMHIDIWEVIEAAKTKPYGFMPFYPGAGVGVNCIPIDPFYLTYKASEYDYHTRLIELAGEINDSMAEFVVLNKLMKALNKYGKPLKGSKVLLLGVTYKADIDDMRESPALKVLEELLNYEVDVSYSDPYVPEVRVKRGDSSGHVQKDAFQNDKESHSRDSSCNSRDTSVIPSDTSCNSPDSSCHSRESGNPDTLCHSHENGNIESKKDSGSPINTFEDDKLPSGFPIKDFGNDSCVECGNTQLHDDIGGSVSNEKVFTSQPLSQELLNSLDAVIILAPHSSFDYEMLVNNAKLIIDTKNALSKYKFSNISAEIIKL